MALDYSKFVDRLTTFNDRGWPAESPIFIKDLVEAGFSYSGESDIVFCYQCGAIAHDWKDNDNPLKKHETLNRNCLFLQKRLIRLCNGASVPQPDENEDDTFDWVEGKGCIRKKNENNNNISSTADGELRTSEIVQEEKKEKRQVDPSMKSEKNRLQSFSTCPVYKNWPCVEQLSKAGFYWLNSEEVMVCFACACEVKSWDAPDQDINRHHKSISDSCPFVNNEPCGNEELKGEEPDIDISQLSISSSINTDQNRKNTLNTSNTANTVQLEEHRRPFSTSYEDSQRQYGAYEDPPRQYGNTSYEDPQKQFSKYEDPQRQYAPYEDPQRQFINYEDPQRLYSTPYEDSQRQYNAYENPQRQYGTSYQDPQRQYTSMSYEDSQRHYSASGPEEDPRRSLATSPLLLKIPDRMVSSTNSSPSYMLSPTSARRSTIADYDSNQNPLFSATYSECPLSPGSLSRSSSYPPNQESPHEFNAELNPSPVHIPIDLSSQSVRLKTFLTYPKDAHVQAVELAEAGFYYINREDCVKCYKCDVMLGKWSQGDTAWNEHRRFSANCVLVQEKYGKIATSPHHQHQPLQAPHQLTPQPSFLGQYDDAPFDPTLLQRYSPRQHLSPTQPPHTSPRFSRNVPDRRINSHEPCRSLSPGDDLQDDPLNNSWPTNIFRHEQRSFNQQQQPNGIGSGSGQPSLNKSPVHALHTLPGKTRISLGYTRNNSFPEKDFSQRTYSDSSYYDNKNYSSTPPGNKLNAADYLKISEQLIHDDQYDSKQHSLYKQQVVKDEVYRRFDERDSSLPLNSANTYGSPVQQNRCSSLHNLSNQRNMPFDPAMHYHRQSSETSHNLHTCQFGHSLDDDMDDRKNCKICMDAAVEVTFVPCGHLVVCQACSQGLKMCPICRKDVDESVRTYFYGN